VVRLATENLSTAVDGVAVYVDGIYYAIISILGHVGHEMFMGCWVVFLAVLNDSCVLSPLHALSEDWDGAWRLWCDWHPSFLQLRLHMGL